MNAQEYIFSQLEALKSSPVGVEQPKTSAEMAQAVFRLLMSHKFRKYSVPEKNQKIIFAAVERNIVD